MTERFGHNDVIAGPRGSERGSERSMVKINLRFALFGRRQPKGLYSGQGAAGYVRGADIVGC
jgi:hypothetical protein